MSAAVKEAKMPVNEMRPYLKQPIWALGLFFVFFGAIGDFVALGFAPTTLVIPIGGFTLVANLFFAHMWLKESLGNLDMISTLLIIVGVILVALFAEKGGDDHTLEQLIDYYSETGFIIYVVVVFSSIIGFHFLTNYLEHIYITKGPSSPEYSKWRLIHPVSYPAMSGICGGQSVLLAKSCAEIIKSTAADNGRNEFTNPVTYAIIILIILFIFGQIHILTKGLKWFDAIFVVPVFQCFFITSSVVGGIVYFKEVQHLDSTSVAGGCSIYLSVFLSICLDLCSC